MKKRKINKIILTILSIFVIFSICTPVHYSSGAFTTDADDFINTGKQNIPSEAVEQNGLENMSDKIYNILLVVGIIVAVIIGMIIGIKLMTGSVEEKAKVKEMLMPYVTGCIVVFGAFTIWKLLVTVLQAT